MTIHTHINPLNFLALIHNVSSKSQINTLKSILKYSNNLTITINNHNKALILKESIQIESTFNQNICRLRRSGLIAKRGKTITLHPIFKDWEQIKEIKVKFKQ